MRRWSLRFIRHILDLALSMLRLLGIAAPAVFKSRATLHFENLALRHPREVTRVCPPRVPMAAPIWCTLAHAKSQIDPTASNPVRGLACRTPNYKTVRQQRLRLHEMRVSGVDDVVLPPIPIQVCPAANRVLS